MSYEGYTQTLCEKGHQGPRIDCYNEVPAKYVCPDWIDGKPCGAKITWSNSVDDTNYDSQGYRMMELLTEQELRTCDFGHPHVWTAATYKPSKNSYWYHQEKGWMEVQPCVCPDCGDKDATLNVRKDDPSDTQVHCITCYNVKQGRP